MSTEEINESSKVTLHFSLSIEGGDVVDSNFEGKPATFIFGDGSLLPGFEKVLLGLEVGNKQQFIIPPEDGFGQPNPNNVQEVVRKSFDNSIELEQGLVISFADAAGGSLPGVVKSFDDDNVTIDFNHPLAGKNILFDVEIVAIEQALSVNAAK